MAHPAHQGFYDNEPYKPTRPILYVRSFLQYPIPAKISGVLFGVDPWWLSLQRANTPG